MAKQIRTTESELKLITEAAERVMENKTKIKELQEQIEKDTELVRKHAMKTGERRYGKVMAYERNKKKLIIPSKMKESDLLELFKKRKLYRYTSLELNKKEIIEQADHDGDLAKLLEEASIYTETETELHLKYY